MKNKYKKAQLEALGLVIIIFLMALGIFFMVSIVSKENKESIQVNPQNIKLAQNTIDAIKNIDVPCSGNVIDRKIPISELIQDLSFYNRIYCNSTDSKTYARLLINNILNKTLADRSKAYSFSIQMGGDDLILPIVNQNCTDNMQGEQGYQALPLPGNAGNVVMKLYICS